MRCTTCHGFGQMLIGQTHDEIAEEGLRGQSLQPCTACNGAGSIPDPQVSNSLALDLEMLRTFITESIKSMLARDSPTEAMRELLTAHDSVERAHLYLTDRSYKGDHH